MGRIGEWKILSRLIFPSKYVLIELGDPQDGSREPAALSQGRVEDMGAVGVGVGSISPLGSPPGLPHTPPASSGISQLSSVV